MTIPPYLKSGDTVGLVCPAGYMPSEKVEACIQTLQQWGFKIRLGNTIGGTSSTYFSGTDEERLSDFQQMLDEDEIKAVLCARGGYGLSRIIENIDFSHFRNSPKWIIGFSDITLLHAHINRNFKIATLHAPMAGAFNDGNDKNEFVHSLFDAITGKKTFYQVASHHFNTPGKSKGEIVGGNLAMLAHCCGTSSAIKTKNKILFIEDVGEYIYNVDRMMIQLKRNGLFSDLSGMIIGGFTEMKDTERPFGQTAYEIIHQHTKEFDYPKAFGFPVSHTRENFALRVGMKYALSVSPTLTTLKG